MTNPLRVANNGDSTPPADGTLRRVRFVDRTEAGAAVVEFTHPSAQKAVCIAMDPAHLGEPSNLFVGAGTDVLIIHSSMRDQPGIGDDLVKWVGQSNPSAAAPPVAITIHGAQVIWGPTHAAIFAAPDRAEQYFLALVDFCFYESELRRLEREVSDSWSWLDLDTPLAHAVSVTDRERFDMIGQRMETTLQRRARLARIEPLLFLPRAHLPPLANQLIDRLREKAHVEARLEALDSQLDVFERIYEMSSQKINDFKTARHQHTLEWVIIILLAAETVLLLIDLLWTMGL